MKNTFIIKKGTKKLSISFILLICLTLAISGCTKKKDSETDMKQTQSEESQELSETEETATESISKTETIQQTEESQQEVTDSDLVQTSPEESTESNENELSENTQSGNEQRQLTAEELKDFSDFVNLKENNGFLFSSYSVPEQVRLETLLYNGAGFATLSVSDAERAAYYDAIGDTGIYTDMVKVTEAQVDEFLQRKMNIHFSDLTNEFTWTYIPDYDAYYTQHGDTLLAEFECTNGYVIGDMYYLDFTPYDIHLTLKKSGDSYLFVSNLTSFDY